MYPKDACLDGTDGPGDGIPVSGMVVDADNDLFKFFADGFADWDEVEVLADGGGGFGGGGQQYDFGLGGMGHLFECEGECESTEGVGQEGVEGAVEVCECTNDLAIEEGGELFAAGAAMCGGVEGQDFVVKFGEAANDVFEIGGGGHEAVDDHCFPCSAFVEPPSCEVDVFDGVVKLFCFFKKGGKRNFVALWRCAEECESLFGCFSF